jgi:regulator of sigma E protease
MTIILFLVVLAVLIFVHELGHFMVAKKSGIRVDEFAIGFPPKIFGWTRGETKYVLNLIPFGGYVKIHGENPDEDSISGPDSARSFVNAKKWKQISVLIAGVGMNIIFAWLLISVSFMFGSKDSQVILTSVASNSPAQRAGLLQGDKLLKVENVDGSNLTTTKVRELIESSLDDQIDITYERKGEIKNTIAIAEINSVEKRRIIGIYMENVGVVKLNPALALWEGGKLTGVTLKQVAVGLGTFLWQTIRGHGDFTQISGPVGIVGLVGDAATFGLAYFLGFVAFISLNLAVINLIPFPALDGGRVLFVAIEVLVRRPIKPQVANTLNTVGFFILISLMLVITYRDITKFF